MKAIYSRLNKLEEALPGPTRLGTARYPAAIHSLEKKLLELKSESARLEAMSPKETIAYIRAEIADVIAQAKAPPPHDRIDGVVGLSANIHAIKVKLAKDGFHSEHHEIRRCELALLRGHGYDTTRLETRHREFDDLPWQWVPKDQTLPDDAQHLIDRILSA